MYGNTSALQMLRVVCGKDRWLKSGDLDSHGRSRKRFPMETLTVFLSLDVDLVHLPQCAEVYVL